MNDENETLLDITGMTCASCARHVDHALRDVEGVSGVEVDLRKSKARVRRSSDTQVAELIEAVERAGYGAKPAF